MLCQLEGLPCANGSANPTLIFYSNLASYRKFIPPAHFTWKPFGNNLVLVIGFVESLPHYTMAQGLAHVKYLVNVKWFITRLFHSNCVELCDFNRGCYIHEYSGFSVPLINLQNILFYPWGKKNKKKHFCLYFIIDTILYLYIYIYIYRYICLYIYI